VRLSAPSPFAASRRAFVLAPLAHVLHATAAVRTREEPKVSSVEVDGRATARIQGLAACPFAELRDALGQAKTWCEILVLPTQNQRCDAGITAGRTHVTVMVGSERGGSRPFALRMLLSPPTGPGPEREAQARLSADAGPYGTTGYELSLGLVEDAGMVRATLSLSCTFGLTGRLALNSYLMVSGGKVGFSSVNASAGRSELVGGARGIVERAAMRHWLALEAWVAASKLAPSSRPEARARFWIAAAERYPLQLREPSTAAYLDAKRAPSAVAPGR
jgi:hypothetical protein